MFIQLLIVLSWSTTAVTYLSTHVHPYLFSDEPVFLKVLGPQLIISGQSAHFNFRILQLNKLRTEAEQHPCNSLAPLLRGHTEPFHQHSFSIVNNTYWLKCNLENARKNMAVYTSTERQCILLWYAFTAVETKFWKALNSSKKKIKDS